MRQNAGANRRAANDHRTRAALTKPRIKLRAPQAEVVAKDIKQWRRRLDIQSVGTAVHSKIDLAHLFCPPLLACSHPIIAGYRDQHCPGEPAFQAGKRQANEGRTVPPVGRMVRSPPNAVCPEPDAPHGGK